MVLFVPQVSKKLLVIPQTVVIFPSLSCKEPHHSADTLGWTIIAIVIWRYSPLTTLCIVSHQNITDSMRILFKQKVTSLACCGANLVLQLILILRLKTICTLLLHFHSEDSMVRIACRASPPRHNACLSTLGILLMLMDHIGSKLPMVEGYI